MGKQTLRPPLIFCGLFLTEQPRNETFVLRSGAPMWCFGRRDALASLSIFVCPPSAVWNAPPPLPNPLTLVFTQELELHSSSSSELLLSNR